MASNLTNRLARQQSQQDQQGQQQVDPPMRLMPEGMQNALGQMGANVLETLAPSPEAEPGSAAFFVPGGARDMYDLANIIGETTGLGQLPAAEHNRRLQQATRDASSETFGVEEPDSTLDLAFRVAGGALVPGGAVQRAAQATTRGGRATDLAMRLAVPLNQGRTAREFGTEAALGIGVPVGIQETLGATGTIPQEQFDTVLEPSEASAETTTSDLVKSLSQSDLGEQRPGADRRRQEQQKQQPLMDRLVEQNQEFLRQRSKEDNDTAKWVLGTAAAIGGPLVGRAIWRRHRARQQALKEQPESLQGVENILTGKEEAMARGADTLEGLAMFNERLRGGRDETFRDILSLAGNPVSRSTRAEAAVDTGYWPSKLYEGSQQKGTIKMPTAPKTVANAIRQHPNRDEVRRLIDYRDELDTRKFAAAQQKENIRTRYVNLSNEDLANEISRIEGNVRGAKQIADQYNQITRSSLDYMRSRGFLNEQDYSNLTNAHPNYVPRMYPRKERGLWDKWFDNTDEDSLAMQPSDQTTLELSDQTTLRQRRQTNITDPDAVPAYQTPDEALENYVRKLVSDVDVNDARLRLLRDNNFEEARSAGKDTVSVRVPSGNATRTAHYRVPDPFVQHLLKFNAPMARTFGNAIRQMYQSTTTGRVNPLFAPISLFYDARLLSRAVGRQNPQRVGALPANFAKNIPDVTALPLAMTSGVARGLWGSMKRGAADIMREHIAGNTHLVSMLDGMLPQARRLPGASRLPENSNQLADRLANAYTNSTLEMALRGGGLSGRYNTDPSSAPTPEGVLERYTGRTPASQRAWNAYTSFLDSIQNGARLEFFARNYRRGMSDAELNRLLRDTRDVTGDFSRAGAGGVHMQGRNFAARLAASTAGGFSRAVPYGNVMIQALRRYGTIAKDNPQLFAAALTSSVVLPNLMTWYRAESLTRESNQHDYVDYYWNELSWTDRLTSMYWFQEGEPPENALKVRMLPEDSVFAGMLMGLMDSVAGWSSGTWNEGGNNDFNRFMEKLTNADSAGELAAEINEGATEGISRTLTPGLPPAMNAALAYTNQRARVDVGNMLEGESPIRTRQIYSDHIPEGRYVSDALHDERLQAIMRSFFGIAADTAIRFGEAADRAYYGTGDPMVGLQQGGYEALRSSSRFIPGSNMLFGTEGRRSVYGVRAEKVSDKEKAMKRVTETLRNVTGAENVARLDYPTLLQRQTAGGVTPQNLAIASEIADFQDSVKDDQRLLDEKWDELNGIDQATHIPASRKPAMRNEVIRQMTELREAYHQDIVDFEERMSRRFNTQFRLEDFQLR